MVTKRKASFKASSAQIQAGGAGRLKKGKITACLLVLLCLISCSSQDEGAFSGESIASSQPLPAAETDCPESSTIQSDSISGTVMDENGVPLPGAIVRVKATENETRSGSTGSYTLTGLTPGESVFITAWVPGYFIHGVEDVLPGSTDVKIHLHAHHDYDSPDYEWLPSLFHPGEGENQGCSECHSITQSDENHLSLPVDEWLLDAHAGSARNPRFLTMYLGQDVDGNQSPQTRFTTGTDYGQFPLLPDPNEPYYGPGYKLDFPDTEGNCAACHTPLPAVDTPYSVDPSQLSGIDLESVSCDFCHKVWDITLDPSGLPYANMPGVLSYEFRRPPEGHQFFAGPLDDVAPGEDTYSPLQTESQFCAGCHYGVFWDTVVYNSFGEWLESPYSDPETGQTCQDCHMPPLGRTQFALTSQGGTVRDASTIYSHRMPGASDVDLLQNAVTMNVEAERDGNSTFVEVSITNDQTGHHVPTDSPLRHLILLVEVYDAEGSRLQLLEGERLPEWCGLGDPEQGYY
ncbi:MAG: carboxypeptidase regulatory-like domain-containing protein, partial [Anaerolineales bacterium]|nr:carboxypeptidase regulatory-like domain-containing protein [Anaerolineales bacterium]